MLPLFFFCDGETAAVARGGLLKIDIGVVLETISDPKIPAERVLGGGLAPSSPGGTSWLAARYFLSDRMLA